MSDKSAEPMDLGLRISIFGSSVLEQCYVGAMSFPEKSFCIVVSRRSGKSTMIRRFLGLPKHVVLDDPSIKQVEEALESEAKTGSRPLIIMVSPKKGGETGDIMTTDDVLKLKKDWGFVVIDITSLTDQLSS